MGRCDLVVDARSNLFLAGVRAGREPDWPRIDLTIQLLELATVDRQGGGGGLQVADRADFSRAEMPQPFGLLLILSETHRKRLEHRTDQPRPSLPAYIRPRREPAVDQRHRDAAGMGRQYQVGP